jgi:hypothetical protein
MHCTPNTTSSRVPRCRDVHRHSPDRGSSSPGGYTHLAVHPFPFPRLAMIDLTPAHGPSLPPHTTIPSHPIPSRPVLSTTCTTHSMPLPLSLPLPLPPLLASRPTAYPCTQPHPRQQVFVRGLVEKQETHLDRATLGPAKTSSPLLSSLLRSTVGARRVRSMPANRTSTPPPIPT